MADKALNEAISQVANALQVAYGITTALRKDLAAAERNALAMEQSMWTAVAALRRLQSKNGGTR